MKDRMGREIDYMRFSITDRCNLRCKYCMPDGIDCMPRWDVLSLEEFEAIAIAAASLGIKKIKVTGGEPLARKSCPQLVKMLKNIPGIEKVTLTTNGVQLDRYLDQLLDAGLDAINVSLDTVDPVLYEKITGRDKLSEVMKVIEKDHNEKKICIVLNDREQDGMEKLQNFPLRRTGSRWQNLQSIIRWMCVL